MSRGDRNRKARLKRLRAAVPATNAIVGIDPAERKQMVVVTDHDSKVLARRTFRCKAWDLGAALDWAAEHSTRAGFAGATVACEPTGHRWRVLDQPAGERGMSFVDFARTRRLGPARFEHAVCKELSRRGRIRPCLRILRNLYSAMADPAGVFAHRLGAFERISWLIEDWDTARAKLADTEARMVTVLDDLEHRAGLLDQGPLCGRGCCDPRRDR